MEAGKRLLGTLARTSLKYAILEAEDARNPINPQVKEKLKRYFATADQKIYLHEAYEDYSRAWKREKGAIWGKFLFNFQQKLARLKKRPGRKEQLVNQKIINPLNEICREKLSLSQLGELLIRAALGEKNTEEICSHFSKFYIDPKQLVQEVDDALTLFGEKDRIFLPEK